MSRYFFSLPFDFFPLSIVEACFLDTKGADIVIWLAVQAVGCV
jgi:hypothetical protein